MWLSPWGIKIFIQTVEVGTPPADGEAAPARVEAAVALLSFRPIKTWLNSIVTGGEKCVRYANIQCKWLWCPPMSPWKMPPNLASIEESSCGQSGERERACCYLKMSYPTPASICNCTSNNWILLLVRYNATLKITVSSASSTTTPDPTPQTLPSRSCLI